MSIFGSKEWWYANIFDSISRWTVTMFIMISGILLLNKEMHSYKKFIKKRVLKIVIPLIVWSSFYYIYKNGFSLDYTSVKNIIKALFEGNIYYHLWFMYTILGIYLVIPILKKYIDACEKKDILYFIGLWLVFVPAIQIFTKIVNVNMRFSVPMLSEGIGIFVLG